MQFFLTFLFSLLIGCFTARQASKRGRRAEVWFIIGVLLGVFGLILLFILPSHAAKATTSTEPTSSPQPLCPTILPKHWFYVDKTRNPIGPIPFHALETLWNSGELSSTSYVWYEGLAEWKKIKELDLFQLQRPTN